MRGGRTRSFDISGPIGLSFSLKLVTKRRPVFYGRLSRLGPTPLKVMPLVPSQAARPRSGSQQARMNPRGKLKACPTLPRRLSSVWAARRGPWELPHGRGSERCISLIVLQLRVS